MMRQRLGLFSVLPIVLTACLASCSDDGKVVGTQSGGSGGSSVGSGGNPNTGGNHTGGGAGDASASGGTGTGGSAGSGGAGGVAAETCGGETCGPDEFCCGPAECGHCANQLTGPNCPTTCTTPDGGN